VGWPFFYPTRLVKKGQAMQSDAKQKVLPLAFGVHHGPKDAPTKVVRRVESAAMALDVSMRATGCKLAYVAACIGKSESYVSLMRAGKRGIPERLIKPLCAATGSNLLYQFHQLQMALREVGEADLLADMLRAAA
jgi:hypothetical protein